MKQNTSTNICATCIDYCKRQQSVLTKVVDENIVMMYFNLTLADSQK